MLAFPTCVGMNRQFFDYRKIRPSVPYMCGDEPNGMSWFCDANQAFPTCVGMNRRRDSGRSAASGVPYMCGDEPMLNILSLGAGVRSLHVWG